MTLEELTLKYTELKDNFSTLESENESNKTLIEDYKTKETQSNEQITKLKESNMALFLKVSNETQVQKNHDNTQNEVEEVSTSDVIYKLING